MSTPTFARDSAATLPGEKCDITIAKGLAILLVVLGHLRAHQDSIGNEWFTYMTHGIYQFHMAFFMYLSGYVFFRFGRMAHLRQSFGSYVRKQFIRCIIPCLLIGAFILVGKLIASKFLYVSNVPFNFMDGLRGLLWETDKTPATFIWYMFAIFIYGLAVPWLDRLFKGRIEPLLIVALGLYLLPPVSYMYLNFITEFAVFFVLGGALRQREGVYEPMLDRFRLCWLFLFAATFAAWRLAPDATQHWKLVVGMASIPALHSLCRYVLSASKCLSSFFYRLGQSSYSIYLLNTLVIGLFKAIVFKLTDWNGLNLFWVAPLLVAAGLGIPLLVENAVLLRFASIRRTVYGRA